MSDQTSDLQALLQRALAAHGAGNLPEAETLYREVLSRIPGQPTALYLLGVVALQVGRADVAVELIGQSLQREPANPEAHYNLGNAYLALERTAEAESGFREAIRLQPEHVAAHYNLGNLQRDAGELADAERSFREAVRLMPALAQAWCNLGLVLDLQDRLEEAVDACRAGLEAAPKLAEGHSNLGNVLMRLGRTEEAVACYRDALSSNPLFGTAYRNLGTALREAGREEEAGKPLRRAVLIEPGNAENCYNLGTSLEGSGDEGCWFRRALAIRPDYTAALYNAGTVCLAEKAYDEAEKIFLSVVARMPADTKAWGNLGVAAQQIGKMSSAALAYKKSLCLDPAQDSVLANCVSVWLELLKQDKASVLARAGLAIRPFSPTLLGALGLAELAKGYVARAERLLRSAVLVAPDEVSQYINLYLARRELNQLVGAEAVLRRAMTIAPGEHRVLMNLSSLLAELAQFEEAVELGTRAIELAPELQETHSLLLFYLHYVPGLSTENFMAAYRRFDQAIGDPLRARWKPHPNRRDPGKRLKIGYVGAGFRRHSSVSMLMPLMRNHDHEDFEIYSYARYTRAPDEFTEEMRALSDHWVPTFGMSDSDLVDRIRSDGIDILVDLSGHTKDNRLLVFAEKPAPVSFHWLDHGVTTGLTAIDYSLGDPVFTPEGSQELFTEKVWNLPRAVFPYMPLDPDLPQTPPPCLENGHVTFGILSRSIRINDWIVALWAEILKRLPDAHFALFSQSCRDGLVREDILRRFARFGVDRERIMAGFCTDAADAHAQIDIMLDSSPHNAGVTACECAFMGLPVVTLRGKPAIGTVGSSMLTQIGRTEWIAETEEDYVRIACDLASDRDRLVQLRASLRGEMEATLLMDGAAFAREFEQACREMWAVWCASAED